MDTNGTNPEMLRFLYENHLLDYIAMDIKTQPEQYAKVSGLQPDAAGTQKLLQNINLSKEYIMSCGMDYEFRTTVVRNCTTRKFQRNRSMAFRLQPLLSAALPGIRTHSCFHAKSGKLFSCTGYGIIVILKFLKRQFQMWNCAEKISSK